MKIIATGVTGFIGSKVVEHLLNSGHEVIAITRSCSDVSLFSDFNENLHFIYYDTGSIKELLKDHYDVDVVIHMATCYGRSNSSMSEVLPANIMLPIELLDECRRKGIFCFINTDTFWTKDSGVYGLSKAHMLDWMNCFLEYNQHYKVVNLKLQHPYGPNDHQDKFVTKMSKLIVAGKSEIELTAGKQKRDFIFIDDVVSAYTCVVENISRLEEGFTEASVGTGKSVSIMEFLELIKENACSSTILKFGAIPYQNNEIMDSVADISFLESFGWKPKVNLRDGVSKIVSSIKSHG